jgi:hypothetical protein
LRVTRVLLPRGTGARKARWRRGRIFQQLEKLIAGEKCRGDGPAVVLRQP